MSAAAITCAVVVAFTVGFFCGLKLGETVWVFELEKMTEDAKRIRAKQGKS